VWVIVAPNEGIETLPVSDADDLVQQMIQMKDSVLVDHGSGVWVFRWRPAPNVTSLTVPSQVRSLAAWTVSGAVGDGVLQGPLQDWSVSGTGRPGYIVSGDYWRERRGNYRATVVLSSTGPVNVEVWNTSDDMLLARRTLSSTDGTITVSQLIHVAASRPAPVYGGVGPFHIDPLPPPQGSVLEIRVWSNGHPFVRVISVGLRPIS
jgi:hypothetical protein